MLRALLSATVIVLSLAGAAQAETLVEACTDIVKSEGAPDAIAGGYCACMDEYYRANLDEKQYADLEQAMVARKGFSEVQKMLGDDGKVLDQARETCKEGLPNSPH